MTRQVLILTTVACTATAMYATALAQVPAASVSQGVYTAEQAARGGTVYAEQCAFCHGEGLEGSGAMPPLTGPDFARNWTGKTLGDLFEKTHGTMPATAPGTLSEQQTADVLAYMLKVAAYPAGTAELAASAQPLKGITIDAPPAGAGVPGAGAAGAGDPVAGAPAAASATTVAQGVYTAEQATRGATLYAEQCGFCHGDSLEGSGAMPPLAGPDFTRNWAGKTVGDLFEKTYGTMPATAPGSLTEQQIADVLAYMLQVAEYPAGTTELAPNAEPLKQIAFVAQ
jgi:mono/diheme cytochrome c family protein